MALWLLLAMGLLGMAAFERFQADGFEQRLRPLRELAVVRAELAPWLQAGAVDGDAQRDAAERAAWLHALEQADLLGQHLGGAELGLANTLSEQARALHAQWAGAALQRSPVRGADAASTRAALQALLQEAERMEAQAQARLGSLRRTQQQWYGLAWAALALLMLGGLGAAWRGDRRWRALQAAVRAEADHQRQMLDLLPQLVWICDADAQSQYLNRRWVQFSGRPLQELLGQGWLELLHPDDRPRVLEEWRAALATGADRLPPFRLRSADGGYRWCHARFGAVGQAQDRGARWFGTSTDVHAVREATAALEHSEQFHRSLLAALNEGVVALDADGLATAVNPSAERLLGLRAQDMLGTRPRDWGLLLQGADGRPLAPAQTPDEVLRSGQACRDVLVVLTRPDGARRLLCVNAEPVHAGADGALSAVVCSFADVTAQHEAQRQARETLEREVQARTRELTAMLQARTEAEQRMQALNAQLHEAEQFARLVADSVPGRLVYWDRSLRCRFVNRTQMAWFGEAAEAVVGRTLAEVRGPAFAERVAPRVAAALAGEPQEFEQTEYSVHGERAETRVQYIPDRRDGEVKGFVVLASNITRDKQAEQLLRQRNEELAQARDRADAANRAKTVFLANMSHEIRTPLNAILGFAHLLRREIDDEAQQQQLGRVVGAASQLMRLLNDLLDLSRLESGALQPVDEVFSLDALLARTGAMAADLLGDKDIELVLHAEDLPDRLRGDATLLRQAMLHLLANAIKFTERGVVMLRVELLEQEGDALSLRFAVQDTGIGIAAEALEPLFAPFAQADGSSTRRHGGTGLGLALTRSIAERMGGELGAQSRPGVGSRFWFSARLCAVGADPAAAPVALLGLRALVVDDLTEARDTLAEQLRTLGMAVDTAPDGAQALLLAEQAQQAGGPYALALVDAAMPGMDGVRVGQQLAAIARPQAMVLLSREDRAALHRQAGDAGFGAVLHKPVTAGTLRHTLLRLLNGSSSGGHGPKALLDSTAGARVLLAEDNPLNQEVVVQMLHAAGVDVDVAGDGQQALQMARERPYDLLLLDVQMPLLDGLEVARRVRATPALERLPMVALTANAFPEDRQACLDAGMNEHLAKPVDPRELHAVLLRWLPMRARDDGPGAAAPAPLPVGDADAHARVARMRDLIDLPMALQYAAEQPDILLRVLQQFVVHHADTGEAVVQQLQAGDQAAAARTLHTLRGVLGLVGAGQLAGRTVALEAALASGTPAEELLAQGTALRDELQALVAGLRGRLA